MWRQRNDTISKRYGFVVLFPDRRDQWRDGIVSSRRTRPETCSVQIDMDRCVLVAAFPVSYQDRGREMLKNRLIRGSETLSSRCRTLKIRRFEGTFDRISNTRVHTTFTVCVRYECGKNSTQRCD